MAQFNRSEMFKMAHKAAKEYKASHANCKYSYGYLFSHALKNAYKMLVSQFQKESAQEKVAPEVAKLRALIGDATGRKLSNIIRTYVKNYIGDAAKYIGRVSVRNGYVNIYSCHDFHIWEEAKKAVKPFVDTLDVILKQFNLQVWYQ